MHTPLIAFHIFDTITSDNNGCSDDLLRKFESRLKPNYFQTIFKPLFRVYSTHIKKIFFHHKKFILKNAGQTCGEREKYRQVDFDTKRQDHGRNELFSYYSKREAARARDKVHELAR